MTTTVLRSRATTPHRGGVARTDRDDHCASGSGSTRILIAIPGPAPAVEIGRIGANGRHGGPDVARVLGSTDA